MRDVIELKWKTRCPACGQYALPGDSMIYGPEDRLYHTTDPCAPDADFTAIDREDRGRGAIPVLPRGKTAKDKCPDCFIIHAPGQDGC